MSLHTNSSNSLFGLIGAKLSRANPKTIFTFRGLSFLDPNSGVSRISRRFYEWFYRMLLRFVDEPVFVSEQNFREAAKRRIGTHATVIRNSIQPHPDRFFSKEEGRKFLEKLLGKNLQNTWLIGSIGRLAYPKNYEFFFATFPILHKRYPEVKVLIIGEGPERKKYESLIQGQKLQECIFLSGIIEDAYRFLPAFDLFVLPSQYEGISISLLEALSASIPVLVSSVGGNPEVLDHSPHQLFRLNDKNDFVEKFKRIKEDKIFASKLAAENKKRFSDFSFEKMVEGYANLYIKGVPR